jgi:hypothetical protein
MPVRRRRRPGGAGKAGPDPSAVGADGEPAEESEDGERQARAPWHFKVIVVGSVVYLGWRLYQGISWLAHHV